MLNECSKNVFSLVTQVGLLQNEFHGEKLGEQSKSCKSRQAARKEMSDSGKGRLLRKSFGGNCLRQQPRYDGHAHTTIMSNLRRGTTLVNSQLCEV
ncbi:hypothetical protein RRG08_020019 [Elysia crispata]|uniref:Uncharacterized protein n=1 Tax=Elysia crispata TaxID=231223 RepID=A0AAE1EEF8_9GAST|nr:hypothetical protein RRG08_020019 [Elysia crispata]